MLDKLLKYFRKNRTEVLAVSGVLLLSLFFRLYKISDYMTFLGDEGRDALVAKGILEGNLTLLGPRASAGDFFLGPIYYYLISPFLLLARYDPVGPAIMVALFGVATVFLVYFVGKQFFGKRAGLIASSLYAISPLVIAYSRSSWNPNLMPFFSLLLLYLLYKSVKNQSIKLFVIVGFLIGITLQLHYLTTFIGIIVIIYVGISEILVSKKRIFQRYVHHGLSLFAGFLIGISPFLLFEIKHSFINTQTIIKFIFADNAHEGYGIGQSFWGNISDVSFRIFGRLVTKLPPPEQVITGESFDVKLWQIATVILAIFSVLAIFKMKDRLQQLLIVSWLILGIALFGYYKKPIYDYYLGFMFPLPFLLVGNFLSQVSQIKKFKKLSLIVAGIIFISLFIHNLTGAPFLFPANKQKDQARNIALSIIARTGDKPYNFALLTKGNSDHVYRYFLEAEERKPVTIQSLQIDPERESVTDQLIVVCEYDCSPLGDPLWEVAGFGRAEIAEKWEVPFVTIFRLVHYEPELDE